MPDGYTARVADLYAKWTLDGLMQSSLHAAPLAGCQRDKSKERDMKRSLTMGASSAGRGLRALVTSAMLFAVLAVTNVGISPARILDGRMFMWSFA